MDILRVVNCFYNCVRWPKGCNVSFYCLIHKIDNAEGISQIESIYKIISKIILKRIKKILYKIIDHK